jgi:hypothetical protein
MNRETMAIDFATQAEVRSMAEARRSETLVESLGIFFTWLAAWLHHLVRIINKAVRCSQHLADVQKQLQVPQLQPSPDTTPPVDFLGRNQVVIGLKGNRRRSGDPTSLTGSIALLG